MPISYRSFSDLANCVRDNAWKIPKSIDLIVGVPRSGMIPATMLAQALGLPLVDLEGYINGRTFLSGRRVLENKCFFNALIVDDSIATGAANALIREKLSASQSALRYQFAAIYADPISTSLIDIYFEKIAGPRIFEWNMNNHYLLPNSCVDIDGVLCRDPHEHENDDSSGYISFLNSAEPRIRFRNKIGWLVTSRLEKYRKETERWLEIHAIEYGELIMLDLPSKQSRLQSGAHLTHKSGIFSRLPAHLFIESEGWQADWIASRSGKQVLCVDESRLVNPSDAAIVRAKVRRVPGRVAERIENKWKHILSKIAHG
jgi:uncharacterized HAD superfamily protein/hypoxanthine phosphoribosyltransferase